MDEVRQDVGWSLSYIDTTARRSIYRADGSLFTDCASNYDPPENGVHLCGQTGDGVQPTTVATYPMFPAQAESAWLIAKDVAECEEGEADFIVDLCLGGQLECDFWSNRQLWPRAIEAWNLVLLPPHPTLPEQLPEAGITIGEEG